MIDREIHRARALLIESNPLMRSVTAAQLRDMGVGQVTQTSRIKDARLLLERESFDIVICNREFEDQDISGQDLLDELRREHLLPHSTVFMMVTSRPSYHQVVEAAESDLDGLLVRPFTGSLLADRLIEARKRKRELADVLRALDAGQTEVALAHALERFREQRPYWMYCGRLAAELLLTLQRPQHAHKLFESVLLAQADTGWAHLGLARVRLALGDAAGARTKVESVLAGSPRSADAYDLMGRILVEQCEFELALSAYRSAAELTPGCMLRVQHAGALAFYVGDSESALQWLERAVSLGLQSKLFDALTLLMIAILRFDRGNGPGAAEMHQHLQRFLARFPESRRLSRLAEAGVALAAVASGDPALAAGVLSKEAAHAMDDDFDLEAANVTLMLWSRLPEVVRPAAEYQALLERIGMRFCVSKAMAAVLAASASRDEAAQTVIRRCQAEVQHLAERAMEQAMRGDPASAARRLLSLGRQHLNAKLLDMASLLALRHQARIPEAQSIADEAAGQMRRSCGVPNHIAGIQRAGRAPGALLLRSRKPELASEAD
jgi:tetratricopeptide (TPR) repeat protein